MIDSMVAPWAWIAAAISAAGCVYMLAAALAVRRFARDSAPRAGPTPDVTLLKPLHGAEPELYANLHSFCVQDYPSRVQIVFGAQDACDPGLAAANRLIDEFPELDIAIVAGAENAGANRKMSSLVAMQSAILHGVVVLSDSDIRVPRDYLRTLMSTLHEPDVGVVTCLYRGAGGATLWSRLAALAIDYQFLPAVLVGLALGRARPCFGSTIALKTQTLREIGGFAAFVNQLADDHAMGEAVRERGMRVAIAPGVVLHTCAERSARDLVAHELRWARTILTIDPLGYAGSVVTYPLPFSVLAAGLGGFNGVGLAAIGAALACRLVLAVQVDHTFRCGSARWWLMPLRDVLSLAVFIASFFVGSVRWKGQRYMIRSDGTMIEVKGSRP